MVTLISIRVHHFSAFPHLSISSLAWNIWVLPKYHYIYNIVTITWKTSIDILMYNTIKHSSPIIIMLNHLKKDLMLHIHFQEHLIQDKDLATGYFPQACTRKVKRWIMRLNTREVKNNNWLIITLVMHHYKGKIELLGYDLWYLIKQDY